jgi:hypothetical protein
LGKTITTPVRVAFLYQYISNNGNNSIAFSFGSGGIGLPPRIYNPFGGGFRIYESSSLQSPTIPNSPGGPPRKICIEWDPTLNATTLYVDPIDGEWCVGATGLTSLTSTNTPPTNTNRFVILRGPNHDDYILDNVTACDAP